MTFTFGDLVLKSSPVVSNSIVYIGSLDGNLYAINENNGNIAWKAQTEGPIESSPAYVDGQSISLPKSQRQACSTNLTQILET